jgi:hypothetical protein
MKQIATLLLRSFLERSDAWGREEGREVYPKLLEAMEHTPGAVMYRIDLTGVTRLDASFPRESFVALAKRYAGEKAFSIGGASSVDLLENVDAAAHKLGIPIVVWDSQGSWSLIGPPPSPGLRQVFDIAMAEGEVTTAMLIKAPHELGAANNVSNKLRQLTEAGYLVRREDSSVSGGKEYRYLAPR